MGAELFLPGSRECKYPAAELCPKTCGLCQRIHAARRCKSLVSVCAPFCGGAVDWGAFLRQALARFGDVTAQLLSLKPPLAEFPAFLSPSEADQLVKVGRGLGFEDEDELPKHIRDVRKIDCEHARCRFHPFVGEVYRRVSDLLQVPACNFESLEFLEYGPGQHYVTHPDASENFLEEPKLVGSGHRILTMFFYLSDVERGGETDFPNAGLTIQPKKGKMVVWANVERNILKVSELAQHASKPVLAGQKVAANLWIHPFDVRSPEGHAPDWC